MGFPQVVDSKEIGKRRMYGTDWPVEVFIHKTHKRKWLVHTICNGISEGGRRFSRLSDAQEYFLIMISHSQ